MDCIQVEEYVHLEHIERPGGDLIGHICILGDIRPVCEYDGQGLQLLTCMASSKVLQQSPDVLEIGGIPGLEERRAFINLGLPAHQLDGKGIAALLAADLAVGAGEGTGRSQHGPL
jgi:hypothetical protein